jgi:hypothetical protein
LEFIAIDQKIEPPAGWWWIAASCIYILSKEINMVFVKLQSKNLLLSQQAAELEHLAINLYAHIMIDGPLSPDEITLIDITTNAIFGRWSISHENLINWILDQGLFIQTIWEELSVQSTVDPMNIISKLMLQIVEGILNIKAERDSINQPTEDLPPVLPHQLVKLHGREFTSIISPHLNHLREFWTDEDINNLSLQHSDLLFTYRYESILQKALESCDDLTSFEDGWKIISTGTRRFDLLRDFCGGIASMFPNTGIIESDFSILGWEKDKHRLSLTDISLEGIIQYKQFDLLAELIYQEDNNLDIE